jgi:N-acylglucosamine 2-epimerase
VEVLREKIRQLELKLSNLMRIAKDNEAIIATLLAWHITGDAKYVQWHQQVHDWSFAHFPDPQHGEWFGYLHRDGTPSVTLKGNLWKGPFHLPRMLWYCGEQLAGA